MSNLSLFILFLAFFTSVGIASYISVDTGFSDEFFGTKFIQDSSVSSGLDKVVKEEDFLKLRNTSSNITCNSLLPQVDKQPSGLSESFNLNSIEYEPGILDLYPTKSTLYMCDFGFDSGLSLKILVEGLITKDAGLVEKEFTTLKTTKLKTELAKDIVGKSGFKFYYGDSNDSNSDCRALLDIGVNGIYYIQFDLIDATNSLSCLDHTDDIMYLVEEIIKNYSMLP